MSTDRDVTRIVRSWLHEDAHEDADRILNLVLDEIDTTPQRRPGWPARRFLAMNRSLRFGLAGVLVVAVAILAFAFASRGDVGAVQTPTPVPSTQETPSPTPTQLSLYRSGQRTLPAGTYRVDALYDGSFSVTIPDKWTGLENKTGLALIVKTVNGPFGQVPNSVLFAAYVVDGVFTDPCKDTVTASPAPASADELVTALTHQVGFEAGPVADTTIGGLPAKMFELDESGAAQTQSDGNCREDFSQWTWLGPGGISIPENNTGSTTPERLWVVDAHGTTILIVAIINPLQASQSDIDELYAIVDSVRFN